MDASSHTDGSRVAGVAGTEEKGIVPILVKLDRVDEVISITKFAESGVSIGDQGGIAVDALIVDSYDPVRRCLVSTVVVGPDIIESVGPLDVVDRWLGDAMDVASELLDGEGERRLVRV